MDPHNPPALAVADHDTSLSVEGEGIRLTPIFQMFGIIVVLLAVAVSLVFNWAHLEFKETAQEAAAFTGYPLLRETRAAAQQQLTQYGTVNPGVYRMPIDRAMDLMVNEARQQTGRTYSTELPLQP
jgi:hypothetical protein